MVESTSGKNGATGSGTGTNPVTFPTLLDPCNDRKCKLLDPPAIKSLEANQLFHANGKNSFINNNRA